MNDWRRARPAPRTGAVKAALGLRMVACFEGGKALLVLAAGFGLLTVVHQSVQEVAEAMVQHLHLDAAARYPRIFLELMQHTGNLRLWMLALFAFVYATLRMAEAYGLWHERRWAEWVAVVSGGIYIPFEIYELQLGVSAIKVASLVINAGIVGYLVWYLLRQHARVAAAAAATRTMQ